MIRANIQFVNKQIPWEYLYLGLKAKCITKEQVVVLTGLSNNAVTKLIREQKKLDEEAKRKSESRYQEIIDKHGLTKEDIDKFHLILKEVIEWK